MAIVINPASEFLREPNLLVPGKKPLGSVKVDFSNSLSKSVLAVWLVSALGPIRDIVSGDYTTVLAFSSMSTQANWFGLHGYHAITSANYGIASL